MTKKLFGHSKGTSFIKHLPYVLCYKMCFSLKKKKKKPSKLDPSIICGILVKFALEGKKNVLKQNQQLILLNYIS